jgi:hypothetical protein
MVEKVICFKKYPFNYFFKKLMYQIHLKLSKCIIEFLILIGGIHVITYTLEIIYKQNWQIKLWHMLRRLM